MATIMTASTPAKELQSIVDTGSPLGRKNVHLGTSPNVPSTVHLK